jgi:hypothetical protein
MAACAGRGSRSRAGNLWVGTNGGGLDRYDRTTGRFVHHRHDPANGLLWLGTRRGGLDAMDRTTGRFTPFRNLPGDPRTLSNDAADHLSVDRAGQLGISTRGGLDRLDPRTRSFTRYLHDPRDPQTVGHDYVSMTLEDRRSVVAAARGPYISAGVLSMLSAVRSGAAGIVLGISILSCGRGGGQGDPATVTASDLIEGLCTMAEPCCGRAHRDDGGRQCRTGMESMLAAGAYDSYAGAACMAMLRASTPAAMCEIVTASGSPCQRAIGPNRHPGSKRPGEPCTSSADCAASPDGEVECREGSAGRWCEVQLRGKEGDGPCIGTVLPRQIVATLEPAGSTPARAFLCYHADDLQCDQAAGSRCVRPKPTGAPCETDAECGKDAYCRTYEFACRPLKPIGASCNPEVSCVDDAYCPLTTHTCTAWLPAGATCCTDEQCHSHQCEHGSCAPRVDAATWPVFLDRFCASGNVTAPDGGLRP